MDKHTGSYWKMNKIAQNEGWIQNEHANVAHLYIHVLASNKINNSKNVKYWVKQECARCTLRKRLSLIEG